MNEAKRDDDREAMDPGSILEKWLARSRRIQNFHYDAAARFLRLHYRTGGALVVLTVIQGSTLIDEVAAVYARLTPYSSVITTLIALAVSVLAALQAFMSFETRSRLHQLAGVKYGEFKRLIETKIASRIPDDSIGPLLEDIGPKWNALVEESPSIPEGIWHKKDRWLPRLFKRFRKRQ